MRNLFQWLNAAVVCGLLAVSAPAARAEVTLSVYGGSQSAERSTLKNSNLGDVNVHWVGRSFNAPLYYGLRVTWWKDARWGYGLEYNHTKVYADDPQRYGYSHLEITDGLNIITANIWRRWQNHTRFTPYVGAGLGIAVPHIEVTPIGGPVTSEYQFGGPAAQIVAGVSYRLDERWSMFAEYKGVYSRNKGNLRGGGTYRTNIATNAINVGLTIRF
ncbi:outer membrane beta-barrel protein [bacterium]|nr:outer membrane beta-barrel protein [bacterium]